LSIYSFYAKTFFFLLHLYNVHKCYISPIPALDGFITDSLNNPLANTNVIATRLQETNAQIKLVSAV